MKHALRLLFKLGVIAPLGRHVWKRVRLAGAWDWQPCGEDVGTPVVGLPTRRSQMRYNDSGIGVVVALMNFLSHTVLQPLELAWNVWAA
jgi:hypothetical protein